MSSVYTMKRIWLQKDKKAYQAWRELMEKAEPKNEQIFQSLGFQKVVANQEVLFMEQGKPDFADYLGYLTQHK